RCNRERTPKPLAGAVEPARRFRRLLGNGLSARCPGEDGQTPPGEKRRKIKCALPGTLPSYSGPEGLQTAQPTTGRTVSICGLLHGAMRADGAEYAPWPRSLLLAAGSSMHIRPCTIWRTEPRGWKRAFTVVANHVPRCRNSCVALHVAKQAARYTGTPETKKAWRSL